ncbi:MAG: hypothetical protein J6S89_08325 [Paludibacteraceae bacterium]|nr:hypothetical protein [Paludibacteraceae bacterium]MBP5664503.1 hypothetical protein [Bacteroidales bacterium]
MNNLELNTCLRYTPFDNKVATIFGNDADAVKSFYDNLFEQYEQKYYNPLKQKLDSAIQAIEKRFIYFVGPAGSGKTTFLHYYFMNIPKEDNVNYSFVNLVEYPAISMDDDTLKRSLCNYIDNVLDEEAINRFIDKYLESGSHMSALVEGGQYKDTQLLNFLFRRKYENKLSALTSLLNCYNPVQLAAIFVILSIYKKNGKEAQNVFVFDNIDELSSTYIGKKFVSFVLDVFSVVQEFFYTIDTTFFETGSPYIDHCTFLIAIRAINAKLLGESQQLNERVRSQNVKIEFNPYIYSYPKMLKKRIDFYAGISQGIDETEKRLAFRRYSQMVADEKQYVVSHLEPLLNFDRRILTLSFNDILNKSTWFGNLESLPDGIGRRGAVILNTLDFLYHENNNSSMFATYVQNDIKCNTKEESKKCNIHRMCFTLLSNLSGLSSIAKNQRSNVLNDESVFFEHLEGVRLDLFVNRLRKWYSDDEIKNVLDKLVSISSSNYEVPVFLEGDVVDTFTETYYKSQETNISTPSYVHSLVDHVMTMSDSAKQSVSIKINPLCVIYPYHIFIHFEYFNLLSFYAPGQKNNDILKPLFIIDDKKELRECLDRVWLTFENMINGMQTHFCNECGGNCKKNVNGTKCKEQVLKFKDKDFCFNGALYSTRCISSIVNYLDYYRTFIWKKSELDKEIQNILITEIRKYIDKYWEKKIQDDTAKEKMAEISRNIRDIEGKGEYAKSCMLESDDFGIN